MDNKKIFNQYVTNHYSNFEKTDFSNTDEIFQLLRKNNRAIDLNLRKFFQNFDKKKSILDLGCGYGSFLFFLHSMEYKHVTGVDLSSEEIGICKKLFPSYQFFKGDIREFIHATEKKFDVIYLSHVIEHLRKNDLFEFLEGIKKILTDEGFFIILAPNSAAYFNSSANRYGDLTHEIGFTDLSLRQVLLVSGFKKIEIRNFYGAGKFGLNIFRKISLLIFECFIQLLGYDKQKIYTPSILTIVQK